MGGFLGEIQLDGDLDNNLSRQRMRSMEVSEGTTCSKALRQKTKGKDLSEQSSGVEQTCEMTLDTEAGNGLCRSL